MAIRAGKYIIHHADKGKIFIAADDGESGEFDIEQVQEALDYLWAKYF